MSTPLNIGLLVFPDVTQLDLTGPLQVFTSVPGVTVHLGWKDLEPVQSDPVLTHWAAMDSLESFGAIPARARVCDGRHRLCLDLGR
jgi:putative intracellular protease/amidase